SLLDVSAHPCVIGREILLHQPVAVASCPVEDVVRIAIDEIEVHPHGLEQIFADALRHLPSPLRVEMRVRNNVQRRCLRDVGRFHGLRTTRNGHRQCTCRNRTILDPLHPVSKHSLLSLAYLSTVVVLALLSHIPGRCETESLRTRRSYAPAGPAAL